MSILTSTITNSTPKMRLSLKVQTIAAALAIIGAVVIPQIFHVLGAVSGLGTALGETFLPMHLPIILAGLLAGPYAGALAGLLGPLISYMITGMPMAAMLPIMMLELCAYGAAAGLLRTVKIPNITKIIIAQFGGRIIRAAVILVFVYAFGREDIKVASIWTSVVICLPGLALQWSLLPLLMYRIENLKKNEK